MRETPAVSTELLIELARQQGLDLGPERGAALRLEVESLLRRLAEIGERLPADSVPAPGAAPRVSR